ncbi:unnamed protein product [Effrenium voratum]|nr:unnamed protein product [Effrenium voratum]
MAALGDVRVAPRLEWMPSRRLERCQLHQGLPRPLNTSALGAAGTVSAAVVAFTAQMQKSDWGRRNLRRCQVRTKAARCKGRYQLMADVAVLSADAERGLERAEELLDEPQVRSVAVFEPAGVGLDPSRVGVRHVAGDPNLEIAYKEQGLTFRLDLSKRLSRLSRCQGGSSERQRLCQLVAPGERVLVLGSGIGITACLIGAHSPCADVLGVERDPVKNDFACANIQLNKLEGKVRSISRNLLDVADLGLFHRICAFLKFQPVENLKPLISALAPEGTLHFYNHESKEQFRSEPVVMDSFARICGDRSVELTWRGRVPRRSIAPNMYRVGMDLRIA